ncbi:hypothetical protein GIB67_008629 [Kingdonia uniflora]|uniref:ELYS-like domain-containing protein n=1 Tax=Kingdonia uniflora TaxID=39325 RepID=A0A7J7M563_9MAGN|nr:hypothetical protein GIB67_008629 [Kingdonia uniflora]
MLNPAILTTRHGVSSIAKKKSAAMKRCWPDLISKSAEPGQLDGSTLFIEDALSHLQIEHGYGKDNEITALVKDGGSSSFLRSKLEGAIRCYPFESLRAAADILFLCGSSDLVIAKQAIFLYYLFDRHWTTPDEKWRCLIDDFAASFGISRQSLLESLTFYLLDDHTDHVLQSVEDLIFSIYPHLNEVYPRDNGFLIKRKILLAHNEDVKAINVVALNMFLGEPFVFLAADKLEEERADECYPTEYLNSLDPPGILPFKLQLKVGLGMAI